MLPLSCTPLLLYEFHQLLHGQLESPQGVVSGGCHLWVGELVGYLWVSHLGGGRVGGLPMGGLPRLGRVVADWWLARGYQNGLVNILVPSTFTGGILNHIS